MQSAKRKAIAQNLKFKEIVLSIEFYISYFVYYIAKMKRYKNKNKTYNFVLREKVLSFELWFFAFRFKFLTVYDKCKFVFLTN